MWAEVCSCCRGAAESGDASHHPATTHTCDGSARLQGRLHLCELLGEPPHRALARRIPSVCLNGRWYVFDERCLEFDAECLLPSCPTQQSVSPGRRRSVQTLVDSANYSSQVLCKVPRSTRWCAAWRARLCIGAVTSQLPGVPLDLAGRSRGLGRADLMRFNDLPLFQLRHRGSVTRQTSLDSRTRESGVPEYGWPVSTSSRSTPARRSRYIRC